MSKIKNKFRCLNTEQLEDRKLLTGDSGAFFGFGNITASFAPDNTQIGFRKSELHAAFDARFGVGQWEPIIERAIQTWAREAEINIGFVADNGAAAGVYGPSQGDGRFGDIRIFGVSLGQDVWAEAINENARQAGTWAGDIVFNVDANWRNLQDLETVAIHEIGHVLGLDHSTDPNSPMNSHGPSTFASPTATDIALLQALHGPRDDDPTEGDKGNDSLKEAHRIKGNEADESESNDDFNGSQIWLQFGDLKAARDVDVYEIHTASNYNGPLAIAVRTRGLSLARIGVEVLDRNEHRLAGGSIDASMGGQARYELPQITAGEKYFIRISALDDAFWAQGDFAITVGTPSKLSSENQEIVQWSDMVHRWYFDSRGAKRGFSFHLQAANQDGYSDDDHHLDDEASHARILTPTLMSDARIIYSTVGSVTDLIDVDYLRFSTPKLLVADSKMLVNLESLELNRLVPEISVLRSDNTPLEVELLSVGYGATRLLIHNVSADTQYLIRMDSTDVDAAHRTGNYALQLELSSALVSNDEFAVGQISDQNTAIDQTLYVAIPQVITFSLASSLNSESLNSGALADATQATFQLFDNQRNLLHNIVAPLGKMRSLPGVLLDAGEYFIQVSAVSSAPSMPLIDVRLSGTRPSDPIGPLIANVDSEPIYTCETGGDFCFPDGTESPHPSHVGPGPVLPLPPPPPAPMPPPPDNFFWSNDLVFATNPRDTMDASGDGIVSAQDALLIINYLNSYGSGSFPSQFVGYIDTNADRIISPIDVLLVINALNS